MQSSFPTKTDTIRNHAYTHGKLAQDWIAANCSEFISKDELPPNSSDLSRLDDHV